MYICDAYKPFLRIYCQRFNNNFTPVFRTKRLLSSICSAIVIKDTPALKTYIHSPKNICHHVFQNDHPIRHLMYA